MLASIKPAMRHNTFLFHDEICFKQDALHVILAPLVDDDIIVDTSEPHLNLDRLFRRNVMMKHYRDKRVYTVTAIRFVLQALGVVVHDHDWDDIESDAEAHHRPQPPLLTPIGDAVSSAMDNSSSLVPVQADASASTALAPVSALAPRRPALPPSEKAGSTT